MSITVPYSEFQTPNNTLAQDGGSWVIQRSSSEFSCRSARNKGCSIQGCLTCTISNGAASSPSYTLKYLTNVSVPMSQYGNINSLDYSFSYYLIWTSDKVAAGLPLSTKVTVGSSSNTDNFISVDHVALWDSAEIDLGNPFSHSGTTSLLNSADGNTAYIPITIDFSFAKQRGLCEWYLIAHTFSITTPTNGISGPNTGALAPFLSSSSLISASIASIDLSPSASIVTLSPGDILLPSSEDADTSTSNSSGSSSFSSNSGSTQSIPIGAILGVVLGGNFFLGIVLVFLFLLYKRRKRVFRGGKREDLIGNSGGSNDDVPNDDRGSTWIPTIMPTRKRPFVPIAPSSLEAMDSTRLSSDQLSTNGTVMTDYSATASVITSQLQSDSQYTHTLDHRTLRHDLRQPPLLSPPIEVDTEQPSYNTHR
ncbi:hypothetical protein FRC14_001922 [Serendipita sp. 396]|nr:hypothetical protein FRC14_001922 [Serendipita sp. 396]